MRSFIRYMLYTLPTCVAFSIACAFFHVNSWAGGVLFFLGILNGFLGDLARMRSAELEYERRSRLLRRGDAVSITYRSVR